MTEYQRQRFEEAIKTTAADPELAWFKVIA